jgi:hypothetical protein
LIDNGIFKRTLICDLDKRKRPNSFTLQITKLSKLNLKKKQNKKTLGARSLMSYFFLFFREETTPGSRENQQLTMLTSLPKFLKLICQVLPLVPCPANIQTPSS